MPITILPHEDFKGLSGQLIEELSKMAAGIKPYPVVIPSIPFSDHLQLEIATQRGICMGIEFLTPSGFIARTIGKDDENPWSVDQLLWKILPHAKSYAVNLGMDSDKTSIRDLFAVSGLLADRFDQYAHFRPNIIRKWNQGLSCLPESIFEKSRSIPRTESWQRELWSTLKEEIGSDTLHPALALESIAGDTDVLERIARDFPHVTVLGTGSIDPLLIEVLQILDKAGCNIVIHVLLPTMEFLGDLHRRKELPSHLVDSEEFTPNTGHPLLRSMGRHAVGSFLLLGELDEQYSNWPESSSPEHPSESASLLKRLQSGIRTLTLPRAEKVNPSDLSIRVHSCYGPRREMEVLRDELLRAFEQIPDLKPHEIHIVTPSLEIYAPLVSAVLEQIIHEENPTAPAQELDTPLPVRITELFRADQDPVTLGLLTLLEMAVGGRYEASWVMELLQLSAVQKSLGITDDERGVELVRRWIKESGLTQGFAEEGGTPKPGSWAFARARLIAGSWLGDLGAIQYPQNEEYVLPVNDELGGGTELLARFIAWHDTLEETLKEWKENRNPSEWGMLLKAAATQLLGSSDGEDLNVRPHLLFLKNLSCVQQVDVGSIFDWLDGVSGEGRRRAPNSGKITFGRFKQLQNIPARVLAMVGMKDGSFPGQSRIPAWDLLQHSPRIWDRNLRIDDRQLFLDALLTAEEKLIITGPTRNIRNNNEEPFSSCVDELLRVLVTLGAERSKLVVKHRLQPFSADYFHPDSGLPRSFSLSQAKVACEISEATEKKTLPFWKKAPVILPAEPIDIEINLNQLVKFWENPAKGFLKAQGISLWSDDEDDEGFDRAPFELNALDAWKIKDAILHEVAFGEGDLKLSKAQMSANRMLPPGSLGTLAWEKNQEGASEIGTKLKELSTERKILSCEVTVPKSDRLPEIKARVSGEVLISGDSKNLVAFRTGKFGKGSSPKPKNYLRPMIGALFASLEDNRSSLIPTMLIDDETGEEPRILEQDLPESEALINALISGYIEGQYRPLCFALQTSNALAKNLDDPELVDLATALQMAKEGKSGKWYGEDYLTGTREGGDPAAQLAWRDLDPFEEPEQWKSWAEAIALPLRTWGEFL